MLFLPFIITLIVGFCLGAPSGDGQANRRPDGELLKFDHTEEYSEQDFTHAFLRGLYEVTWEDIHRLDRFKTALPNLCRRSSRCYCYLLRDMVKQGLVEHFKVVFPHVRFSEHDKFDVVLMAECGSSNEPEILDFMLEQRACDAQRFIDEILHLSEFLDIPEGCVEAVRMVATRNAEVAARTDEIYTEMLHIFLFNEYACVSYQHLARELVRLGADADAARANIGDSLLEEVVRETLEDDSDIGEFIEELFGYRYVPADADSEEDVSEDGSESGSSEG
jgi:hypothetical protein